VVESPSTELQLIVRVAPFSLVLSVAGDIVNVSSVSVVALHAVFEAEAMVPVKARLAVSIEVLKVTTISLFIELVVPESHAPPGGVATAVTDELRSPQKSTRSHPVNITKHTNSTAGNVFFMKPAYQFFWSTFVFEIPVLTGSGNTLWEKEYPCYMKYTKYLYF